MKRSQAAYTSIHTTSDGSRISQNRKAKELGVGGELSHPLDYHVNTPLHIAFIRGMISGHNPLGQPPPRQYPQYPQYPPDHIPIPTISPRTIFPLDNSHWNCSKGGSLHPLGQTCSFQRHFDFSGKHSATLQLLLI